ncbi:MAG: DUF4388 domain-containing protein [Caldithrix sp.]|nr:DUF4388 domain-containing protein [Caldithrix sp.]
MALLGNLNDLKLPSLIQLNCMERNTAKLTIEYNNRFGFMYFDDGQIVHAEYEPDIGETAVYRLLNLPAGKFKVETDIKAPMRSINSNWSNLLLEGMHKKDNRKETETFDFDHLFEKLMSIHGVEGAYLMDRSGEIIAKSPEERTKSAELLSLTIFESEQLAEDLDQSHLESLCIEYTGDKFILFLYNQLITVLRVDVPTKHEKIYSQVKRVLN